MSGLVSIILPTYNASEFIRSTICSILRQTYKNFELIIVDDCSCDDTFDLVKKIAEEDVRVSIDRLSKNSGGPATPRNKAMAKANGDFIAFVDSDDIWHPEHLERAVNVLQNGVWFVSSRKLEFCEDEHCLFANIDWDQDHAAIGNEVSYDDLLVVNSIPNSSVVCIRSCLENREFSVEPMHVAVEDFLMWASLHRVHGASLQFSIPSLGYRVVPGSISRNKIKMVIRRYNALRWLGITRFLCLLYLVGFVSMQVFKRVKS